MDRLKEMLQVYEDFCKYDYRIVTMKNDVIDIKAKVNQFPHLVGLDKLVDNPTIQQIRVSSSHPASTIVDKVRDGSITFDQTKQSSKFMNIEGTKLDHFSKSNLTAFLYEEQIYDYDPMQVKDFTPKLTKADKILATAADSQFSYRHLFFVQNQDGTYRPMSFFYNDTPSYLEHQNVHEIKYVQVNEKNTQKVARFIPSFDNLRNEVMTEEIRNSIDAYRQLEGVSGKITPKAMLETLKKGVKEAEKRLSAIRVQEHDYNRATSVANELQQQQSKSLLNRDQRRIEVCKEKLNHMGLGNTLEEVQENHERFMAAVPEETKQLQNDIKNATNKIQVIKRFQHGVRDLNKKVFGRLYDGYEFKEEKIDKFLDKSSKLGRFPAPEELNNPELPFKELVESITPGISRSV